MFELINQVQQFISSQQAIIEAGSDNRPAMLEKRSNVPLASRFMRYIEQKKDRGKWMKQVIIDGPFVMPTITIPSDPESTPPRHEHTRIRTWDELSADEK